MGASRERIRGTGLNNGELHYTIRNRVLESVVVAGRYLPKKIEKQRKKWI